MGGVLIHYQLIRQRPQISPALSPCSQAVLQNNLAEDPLDNEEQLQDQLDSLPYLCRFQVPPCALICSRRQCCAAVVPVAQALC